MSDMMCKTCRGKGTYAGLDITCRACNGSGIEKPVPIDFSIIQLTTIREAILTVLDGGRLLPDGTRAPWMFYPPHPSNWIYEDQLPQTLSQSDYDAWYAQSEVLDGVRMGPNVIGDWHMDESGDVNEQRTQFCDEIQSYVMKEAQKANAEVIDHKARAF